MVRCGIPESRLFHRREKPLLQVKTQKESFMITAVNAPRKENALTLYMNAYGPSTKTNDYGYEVTVANGKVIRGQNGNSKLGETNMYYQVTVRLARLYVN